MANFDPYDYRHFNVADADPNALHTARRTTRKCAEIASILSPITGQAEATTLFERSIHLCNETFPWMEGSTQGFQTAMNLNALERSIAQQPAETAAAGAFLLLTTFHGLLAEIVGTALAEQLLPPSTMRLPTQDDAK